ncbi:MAG: DUF4340 domain-containing protein [Cyclobacteriaceae bacterium]|nr:DUF4340 domain-containing protein [Cyclobacteriaceae bacterium]
MDPRRNKWLAASLVALLLLSAGLAWISREEEKPVVERDAFAIIETEKVNRVTMARATDTVNLVYDGTRWTANGKDADVQMVKVLMATLRQAEPHRPVAARVVDTVRAQLGRRGTRVTVQQNDGTTLSFTAGGNRGKTEAWFMKAGEPQPYIMIIPGYRVYVSGIFELDASGWRNKRIFDFNWRNFKSLTATYPKEPASGFTVEMKQRYFGIRGLDPVDTTKLNDYLDAVSLLMANRFVAGSGTPELGEPVARIHILDIADRSYSLELFAPAGQDPEAFGRLADGQVVAFDRSDIAAIVRRKGWFVPGRE